MFGRPFYVILGKSTRVYIRFQGVKLSVFVHHIVCEMNNEKGTHKENGLLQRGIFSTSDFEAFQKGDVH